MDQHVARPRRKFVGLATMAVGAVALVGAFPSAAGATGGPHGGGGHGGGGHQPGVPTSPCPDDGWDFHWGPQNQNEVPGTHTDGEFSVEISNVRTEDGARTFDFETSVPVKLVFAVGYPTRDEGVTQEFEPPVTEGTASTGDPEYIKHVYFCPAPETPPTSQDTTTTTVAPTTSSSAPPTTEAPTTSSSSSAPPTSEAPTTTEAPSTSVAPTTTPPTSAVSSEGTLPETGSNSTMPMVAAGVALLAVGVGLVVVTRRLRRA
jgi:LPXTG-motif cell wall-anchored protein